MSHVIDDATSALHDTYDETASMSDTIMPLSEFLDEKIARAKDIENAETDDIFETDEIIETEHFETPSIPRSPIYE